MKMNEDQLKELAMTADDLISKIKQPQVVPDYLRKELSMITLEDAIFDAYQKGIIKEMPKNNVNA